MTTTKEGLNFILKKENRDNLKDIGRQLNNVQSGRGFFNIAKLTRLGLIKEKGTKRSRLGGKTTNYVLTQKGKRMKSAIASL
ncbi:MAG: winged helix DNA-binding protein [Candidatus Pacearchaeota archaeon]